MISENYWVDYYHPNRVNISFYLDLLRDRERDLAMELLPDPVRPAPENIMKPLL